MYELSIRTHHGSGSSQRFVINRPVEVLLGQTAAHRAADLYGLETADAASVVVFDSTRHVINHFALGDS